MKIGSAFPSDYLKAADLNGKAVRVTIASVSTEKLGEDTKPVLHFKSTEKLLALNRTNANRIMEATGSDETDDWTGWTITLYSCKVDYKGQRVDAIRVDDRPGASVQPARRVKAVATIVESPEEFDSDPPPVTDDDIPF